MQLITQAFLASATIATIAGAHDHHGHAHFHKHEKKDVDTVIVNDVAVKYIFDGQEVPYAQVCQGIANGTFIWDDSTPDKPDCSPNAASPAAPVASSSATHIPAAAGFLQLSSSSSSAPSSSAAPSSTSQAPAKAPTPVQTNNDLSLSMDMMSLLVNNPGVDSDFPNGELPCEFSSLQKYGAVPLNYLGLGGFSGVMTGSIDGNGNVQNMAAAGNGDSIDGAYYSYTCPQGYMKTQWPTSVKSSSVFGGVICENGKFQLTNTAFTKLCTPGAGSVSVTNNADGVIAICGTDYPGKEDETVAIVAPGNGGTAKVAITDSQNYYKKWNSATGRFDIPTSAQYYLNPAGTPVTTGCQWGNAGNAVGNWAPINLGLSMSNGMVYVGLLSTEQQLPTTGGTVQPPNWSVQITGGGGQVCQYKDGSFNMNGKDGGYLGQFSSGKVGTVPGVTCAYPSGSNIEVTFTSA